MENERYPWFIIFASSSSQIRSGSWLIYLLQKKVQIGFNVLNFCQILKIHDRVPKGASQNLYWVQDIQNNWGLKLFKACESISHIYVLFPLTSQKNLFIDETHVLQASWKRKKIVQLNLIFILSMKNTGLEKLQIILKDTVPKRSSVKRGTS